MKLPERTCRTDKPISVYRENSQNDNQLDSVGFGGFTMIPSEETEVWEDFSQGWDHELYYSKEPQKGKTYARHGGFVEADSSEKDHRPVPLDLRQGTELFDVTYFNLGTAEVRFWNQRFQFQPSKSKVRFRFFKEHSNKRLLEAEAKASKH